jgi:hypothetical protein
VWKKWGKPSLYGLWRLQQPTEVVLVEGESDCHTLWHHGFAALGVPGAKMSLPSFPTARETRSAMTPIARSIQAKIN